MTMCCTVIARFRFPKTLLLVLVPSFYIWHFYNIPKAATAAGKDPLWGRLLTGREVLRCFVFFVSLFLPCSLFVGVLKQAIFPPARLPQLPTLPDNTVFSPCCILSLGGGLFFFYTSPFVCVSSRDPEESITMMPVFCGTLASAASALTASYRGFHLAIFLGGHCVDCVCMCACR